MTHDDLIAAMAALELRQVDLQHLLDVSDRTTRLWVSGKSPVPVYLELLLETWSKYPRTLELARALRIPAS